MHLGAAINAVHTVVTKSALVDTYYVTKPQQSHTPITNDISTHRFLWYTKKPRTKNNQVNYDRYTKLFYWVNFEIKHIGRYYRL